MTDLRTDTPIEKKAPAIPAPEGHPIHILMKEHELMTEYSEKLVSVVGTLTAARDRKEARPHLEEAQHLIDHLVGSESHYVREENVLFPVIEKHGITGPTRMMWTQHDEIRGLKKELVSVMGKFEATPFDEFAHRLHEKASALSDLLASHFGKENSVLFPAALRAITVPEWEEIRRQFDDLGYCCFTPDVPAAPHGLHEPSHSHPQGRPGGAIPFETGMLTVAELSGLLDSLPVDVTFVGNDDTVRYFNQAADRIFPRAKAVIGRTVQNCHPAKSVDKVKAILDGFRSGALDKAEFWIPMGEKIVMIRYFPVRDKAGSYLGCLEVTQDIAPIKKVEGEKRLL